MSINELVMITAVNYRTVKQRLANLNPVETDSKSIRYDPRKALPLIFEATTETKMNLDLNAEKKRLTKLQADKAERELRKLEGDLVPADQIQKTWTNLVMNFRAQILSLPTKLAVELGSCETAAEREALIKKGLYRALDELSKYDPDSKGDNKAGSPESGAATRSDGKSVG